MGVFLESYLRNFITMADYNKKYQVDEHLLASVAYFAEDSILITETNLTPPGPKIIYVNPGFTKLTGYLPEDVLGKNPRFLQGPRTDRGVLERLRVVLQKGEVFHGRSINYRKDGSEFWNEWHIEPIRDAKGKVINYLAIQRDITERMNAQKVIEDKNIALREVLEHIQLEKKKIQDDILSNVEQVLLPAIRRLRRKGSPLDQKTIDILETNLKSITSSFGSRVSEQKFKLSGRELEIANLIKNGMSSKEISEMLNVAFKTVETHRNRIRKKFKLVNKDINLATYLKEL
jgi:PAS domain S-box-containing protein